MSNFRHKQTSDRQNVKEDFFSVKYEDVQFDCALCGNFFVDQKTLKRHIQVAHLNQHEIEGGLSSHYYSTDPHTEVKEQKVREKIVFQCDTCDFQSTKQNEVTDHMNREHYSPNYLLHQFTYYKCPVCHNFVTTDSSLMTTHFESFHFLVRN